jgi:hypothetical protein
MIAQRRHDAAPPWQYVRLTDLRQQRESGFIWQIDLISTIAGIREWLRPFDPNG